MFIDDVKLTVAAGKGGNGIVAFRREKYVPKGGPAGGNGGRGGSIIFVGDEGLTTLIDLHYRKKITAQNGENGMSKNKYGKDASDVYVKVPIGSVIYDLDQDTVIADITRHNQEVIVAKGGRGGRGNTAFATPRVPAPEFCEKGEPGEVKNIRVELKVLADVGLVGFPSVGKSTLISVISAAKPKIAPYPFTTLVPNLGVVRVKDGRSFIVADLPGLIEGASSGAGLGIQFLKHIERTRVIVHIIDMSAIEGRDPYEDYLIINNELKTYNEKLLLRPQIVVANKMDLPNAKNNLEIFRKKCKNVDIIPISAYTKDNLDELLYKIADILDTVTIDDFKETITDEVVEYRYVPEPEKFTIELDDDGIYHVKGPVVQRYMDMTDFNRDENVKLFAQKIRKLGVDDELRKLGVKHGDTVRILGYEFEFFD
ncbi:MAG TPA: GTPase ObgE [Acholeplasmataceae bacterium]|nr:GTPase ObgE [Acholeplasmataceae bacterium]